MLARRRRKILGFYIVFALENTILKRFLVKILNIFAYKGGFYTKNPHPKSQKGDFNLDFKLKSKLKPRL